MTPLRSKFVDMLRVKGFSETTVDTYVGSVVAAVKQYRISPLELTSDQIRDHLLYLLRERKLLATTVNLHISALKTFYTLMAPGSTVRGRGEAPHRAGPREDNHGRQ